MVCAAAKCSSCAPGGGLQGYGASRFGPAVRTPLGPSASLLRHVWCIYWEDVATEGPCPLRGALDDYGKTRKAMAACNGPDLNVGNAISRQHGMFGSRVARCVSSHHDMCCQIPGNIELAACLPRRRGWGESTRKRRSFEWITGVRSGYLKHRSVAVESITGGARIRFTSWKGRLVSGAWVVWLILDSTHWNASIETNVAQ
jgi:hypothetical protein